MRILGDLLTLCMLWQLLYSHLLILTIAEGIFSRNSEAFASKLLENIEETLHRYRSRNDISVKIYSHTPSCYLSR